MGKKMLIDASHPEETRVVVVQGNRIDEFDFESAAKKQLRGSIYLAKVTRVEPSLQAAFVDYGGNRHGFLAFSEIHPDYYQIPVADREALLEAQAEEERLLAEELEAQEEGRSSRSDSSGRRRGGRRGNTRTNGRGNGRRGRRGGRRRGSRDRDGDVSLTIDADLPEDDTKALDAAPSDAVFQDADGYRGDVDLATAGDDHPSLFQDGFDPAQDDTGDDDTDWTGDGATRLSGWAGAPEDETAETDPDLTALDAEDGATASRPLLADPMPSITVPLPETEGATDDAEEPSVAEAQDGDTDAVETAEDAPQAEPNAPAEVDAADEPDTEMRAPALEPIVSEEAAVMALPEESDAASETSRSDTDDVTAEARPDADDTASEMDETDGDDPAMETAFREADDEDDASDTGDEADEDDDDDGASVSGESDDDDDVETVNDDAIEEEARRRRRARLRQYKIQEVIRRRQIMLVQVVKEERGNKGAALTTYLSLAGRYCVLMPNTARGGGISRKITNAEDRRRLKDAASALDVPEGMGLIIRTAGAQRTKAEIKRDFEYLLRLWENVRDLTLRSSAPTLVYEEGNLVKRCIRDLYSKDIDNILVEGEDAYKEAKAFMRMLMPSHAKHVQQYKDRMPLFQRYQVETHLDSMFSPTVELPSGGYIVINPTEALVAIDVNSGRSTREHNIEDTAVKTNCEAAEEVARQLRLRDLAGLIVIDFIDMEEMRNNRTVEKRLKECLKNDRARIQVGRISTFGLLEMSRQRLRAGVLEGSTQVCPHCEGTGKMRSVESAALRVLRACEEEGLRERYGSVTMRVPTEVALYVLNQKRRELMDIDARYGLSVIVESDHTLYASDFVMEQGELLSEERRAQIAETAISMETAYSETDPQDADDQDVIETDAEADAEDSETADEETRPRRRRGGRRRRGEKRVSDETSSDETADSSDEDGEAVAADGADADAEGADKDEDDRARRRRRRGKRGGRRNRRGTGAEDGGQDAVNGIPADQPAMAAWDMPDTTPQPDTTPKPHNANNGDGWSQGESQDGVDLIEVDTTPQPDEPFEVDTTPVDDRETREPETVAANEGADEGPKKRGWWQRRLFNF